MKLEPKTKDKKIGLKKQKWGPDSNFWRHISFLSFDNV